MLLIYPNSFTKVERSQTVYYGVRERFKSRNKQIAYKFEDAEILLSHIDGNTLYIQVIYKCWLLKIMY